MASLFLAFATTILVLVSFSSLFLADAQRGGFSVELVHRDSPKSPFYNPEETPFLRMTNAFRRSHNCALRFGPGLSVDAPRSEIISNRGEYLMNISLGTPPVEILGIVDTGSDLVWTQCKPCEQCYKQDAPLFNPKKSSTYRDVSCSARQCQVLDQTTCGRGQNECLYSVSYGDRSYSHGNLAVDTVTLGSTSGRPVSLPKTIIGCGHENDGTFNEKGSGIIGLGGGPVSLVSQLGDSIAGKFSYCLVPFSSMADQTSMINFGSRGVVSGPGVVSTLLVKKSPDPFYFLTLEAISVGRKRIEFTGSSFGTSEGNIIIDSGTTLTLLPQDFYSELESAVAAQIREKPVSAPLDLLSLCYSASSNFTVPRITAHFSGADVVLKPMNTFVQVSEDAVCFAFSGNSRVAIYGNLAQMNFLVGYDTESQTVSFKATDCAKV